MFEKEPQPTRAVYTLLVKALENGDDEDSFTRDESLRDVYRGMSNSDPGLIDVISRWEGRGLITNKEKLYLFVLFSVARAIGPYDLSEIRNDLVRNKQGSQAVLASLDRITMDVVLKQFLRGVIEKFVTLDRGKEESLI